MVNIQDIFNDDAEIITRLDECDRQLRACTATDCPMHEALAARVRELRDALKMHLLL
jgi:hypothetical protein